MNSLCLWLLLAAIVQAGKLIFEFLFIFFLSKVNYEMTSHLVTVNDRLMKTVIGIRIKIYINILHTISSKSFFT